MKNNKLYLKLYNQYIRGTVGQDIKLNIIDKLKILFASQLSIVMIDAMKCPDKGAFNLEYKN